MEELRIEPDAGRAWLAAYVFWLARSLPVLIIATILAVALDDVQWVHVLFGVGLAFSILVLGVGTVTALWWRFVDGRVVYVVRDGELLIYQGRRVLRRFRCAEITRLYLAGALTWKVLVLHNLFTQEVRGWPTLFVELAAEPGTRSAGYEPQPQMFLWGRERAREAVRDLRAAVADDRAVSTQ
jgi:hypothetical protein